MNSVSAIFAAVFLTLFGFADIANAEQSALDGIWLTDQGDGTVEIKECGDKFCGTVYSILPPENPSEPLVDELNAQPELRSRPICGMPIIGGLRKLGPDSWGEGRIYDPHDGGTYDVEMTLQSLNVLVVHGYAHVKFIGRTVTWTRAEKRPSKCIPPN